jgi:hypothetical protein
MPNTLLWLAKNQAEFYQNSQGGSYKIPFARTPADHSCNENRHFANFDIFQRRVFHVLAYR